MPLAELRYAASSLRGAKPTNEDRYLCVPHAFPGPVFGVFDGHGGTFTADYLTKHLIESVTTKLKEVMGPHEYEQLVQLQANVRSNATEETTEQLHRGLERVRSVFGEVLKDAFETMDRQLLMENPSNDGSTAVVVWFDGQDPCGLNLFVVNLGDSRAMLGHKGVALPLTDDHKPNDPHEAQRIRDAGGDVAWFHGVPRVFRRPRKRKHHHHHHSKRRKCLAMSRAMGDRTLKIPLPIVSSTPDVYQLPLDPDDQFVVLASDGVWDALDEDDVMNILKQDASNPHAAAEKILTQATDEGSQDNMTAIVIQLAWQTKEENDN